MTPQELQSLRNLGNECEAAADEIVRLRAERDVWKSKAEMRGVDACNARAERDEALADAARYRWLRAHPVFFGWEHDFRPDEVDAAIDAALKGDAK